MKYRIGIDLGGTKTECAVVGSDGEIELRRRIKTPHNDYQRICAEIGGLVRGCEAHVGTSVSIGIGMPGAISPATGLVKNANTVCLNGKPFARDIASVLQREVRIANDANCFVLSEIHGGAAHGYDSAFGVIIGTGTGGGLFVNGGLVSGANAIGGEWGHNPVPWPVLSNHARACYCGRNNCVETFLSGPGLIRSFTESGGHAVLGVEQIVRASHDGDALAGTVLADYCLQLSQCLAALVNVFDPAVIVLGGGLSQLPNLAIKVQTLLPGLAFSDQLETAVVGAAFGDSSGVRGAANLWAAES